jgi:ABC-2 type transport system permease protein
MFSSPAQEVAMSLFNKINLSLARIGAVTFKELKELSRDRITFGMVVMVPLVQLLLFGYAINTDVRQVPSALVDFSNTSHSRAATQAVVASQVAKFVLQLNSVAEAEAAITRGEVRAALILPLDFDLRLNGDELAKRSSGRDQRPVGQWLVDASDPMVATAIKGLRAMPLDEVVGRQPQLQQPSFEVVLYFNPEQRTAVNIVPGLIAVILTMTMILFTAVAIVREREQGNMEFLITTPIHPLELMLGKILPYIFVGLIQTAIILSLGHWIFAVPVNGGLGQLLVAVLLFICASLTLGLLISTIAKTQLQAMQLTVFILLPSILLSGFMFPYEAMPVVAQWIAEALPATHFMRAIRGVVLRAADLQDLARDLIWLAGFSLLGLLVAAWRFQKSLD